ncbi:hypothetical protein BFW87_25225 [Pseudomonas fluorescens]|uniref:Uncharacterized protein n=1 Tax=Pseudomonas fluorescens TaxID=294 RepID=A0A1T2Y1Z9_PSEFL|nr:hypothetical protein [Pseudomonas fluorescens]OPA86063.1 hypothetical protein BFW87_25225 [Pseudomonas fluorescens]
MSITMFLEIEEGVSYSEIISVLSKMKASYAEEEDNLFGNFFRSNCFFVFDRASSDFEVIAESVTVDWKVGVRGSFSSPNSAMEESWGDIKAFVATLANDARFKFVLSFQYEGVYALNNEGGFKIVQEMFS